MEPPTLCIICEEIGGHASIGKIARQQVETALAVGWRVTVVANQLESGLRSEVQWLKLHVPRRSFAFQWLTGRHWIKKAIGKRTFDVVHGHQPQVADLCDVYQCHFSTRAAYEHHCLYDGLSSKTVVAAIQKSIVLLAEDRVYRRWNEKTLMVFVSALLRQEFAQSYALPAREITLENAVPVESAVTPEQRRLAREHYFQQVDDRIVVGYLGGMQTRKGCGILLDSIRREPGIHLLFGGQDTEQIRGTVPGHIHAIGSVENLDRFYAACDVVVVPSVFDPCPVVVVEAISRRIPVIVTSGVGNMDTLLKYKAGLCWHPDQTLGSVVRRIIEERASFQAGAEHFATAQSQSDYRQKILGIWEAVLPK